MTTVRIVCKAPPAPPHVEGHLRINGVLASAVDAHVYLRRDDGTEIELHGVTRIAWTVACDDYPARAVIELEGVELDAEGLVEVRR